MGDVHGVFVLKFPDFWREGGEKGKRKTSFEVTLTTRERGNYHMLIVSLEKFQPTCCETFWTFSTSLRFLFLIMPESQSLVVVLFAHDSYRIEVDNARVLYISQIKDPKTAKKPSVDAGCPHSLLNIG